MVIEAVSSVGSRGRLDSQSSLSKVTIHEPEVEIKSPHVDVNYAKSKSEFGESILFEEVSVGSPTAVGNSPPSFTAKQNYAQSTATFAESLVFEEVSASPKHSMSSPAGTQKSTTEFDLIPQDSILFEEVDDALGATAPLIDTTVKSPSNDLPVEESTHPNDNINSGRHREVVQEVLNDNDEDLVGESPPSRREWLMDQDGNRIPQQGVQISPRRKEERLSSQSPPRSRSPQEGVQGEGYSQDMNRGNNTTRKITRQSSLHNELHETALKRSDSTKESPRASWQHQLRTGSKGRVSRNNAVPAWQVVNQPATSPQKRDKGGAYHGCSFGAPPQPAPSAVHTPRDKGRYRTLRGIDNKRRELLLECNRCSRPGHQARDCDRNRRESNFDPSGGATMQKNFTGTFPPLPPVTERNAKKNDPQLANISSRFRDWESRSATPPVQRSRTPTKTTPQPWKVASGREGNGSPRKKEDVIKKLQTENKKLQRAIEQMKSKMVHLEENHKSVPRDVSLERTVPLPNTARPSTSTPSNHSSPNGVNDSYSFTHPPRSSSLPRKTTSPHEIYATGRKSRTPQRIRGSAHAQVDWRVCETNFFFNFFIFFFRKHKKKNSHKKQSRYTLSASDDRRVASNSAHSVVTNNEYPDYSTPEV